MNTNGIITTVAGNGTHGSGYGDGGAATAARLGFNPAITYDNATNSLYIVGDNTIRKVDASGNISLFAGTGSSGYTGDGGAATNATFNFPKDIKTDNTGNVYIADAGNNVVRKIDLMGNINTVAGSYLAGYGFSGDGAAATLAQLYLPYGLFVDATGNLLIADFGNNRIRKVDNIGNISTIAGTGYAGDPGDGDGGMATNANVTNPLYICKDGVGNLFITGYSVIRKVDTSGIINLYAGSSNIGYAGDGLPATNSGVEMYGAQGLAIDNFGNLLIADEHNNVIRLVGTLPVYSTPLIFRNGNLQKMPYVCLNSGATDFSNLLAILDSNVGVTETWSVVTAPANGSVSFSISTASNPGTGTVIPSTFTYTPNTDYVGTDVFVMQVSNGITTSITTINVTVYAPPYAGTISGPSELCLSESDSSVIYTSDGNAGGTWGSIEGNITLDGYQGIVGYVNPGTSDIITYSVTNSCGSTSTSTFNVSIGNVPDAGAISGTATVAVGGISALTESVSGGTWTSDNTGVATVDGSGNVTGVTDGTANISYAVTGTCGTAYAVVSFTVSDCTTPNAGTISGSTEFCYAAFISFTTDGDAGGTWGSVSGNVSLDGTGFVTSATAGTTDVITYSVTNVCGSTSTSTFNVTIDNDPDEGEIWGTLLVAVGGTSALTESPSGGTWTSDNTDVATVDGSGNVTGVTDGTANIFYAITNTCGTIYASALFTVGACPTPNSGTISGSSEFCYSATPFYGGSTLFSTNGDAGGTWGNLAGNVLINTSYGYGSVYYAHPGTTDIITYSVTNSCGSTSTSTFNVTIDNTPIAGTVSGTASLCIGGATTSLTSSVSGGAWSSSNTAIATVNSATGVVTSVGVGNTSIYYTVTNSCGTANAFKNITVINTLPNAGTISGASSVCGGGATTSFTSSASVGTWLSGSTIVATMNSATGVLTCLGGGIISIFYTVTNSCGTAYAFKNITVIPLPSAGTISGTATVCAGGATTSLTSSVSGGTWNSSNTATATVNSSTGVVTSVAAGNTIISYTVSNTCGSASATKVVTVNPAPATPSITGANSVCLGATTTLSSSVTGGTWSSSAVSIASVTTGGVVTGSLAGNATISYTITGSCGTTRATFPITVNALPNSITGVASACIGNTVSLGEASTGGTWSSSNTALATVNTSGVVTGVGAGNPNITYTLGSGCYKTVVETINTAPATISGTASICVGSVSTLTNAVTGGTWSTSNSGFAPITTGGIVSGSIAGTATISYTIGSCVATLPITINAVPNIITGQGAACVGSIVSLGETITGGTWSSSNTALATVNTSGVVTTIAVGSPVITYSLGGCYKTFVETINAAPATIGGTSAICVGTTTTLTNTVTGGTWSTSNSGYAPITTGGVVTGNSAGVVTISYTIGSCTSTLPFTISAAPASITGSGAACIGRTVSLGETTTGGSWSSSNTAMATVNTSGVVTAMAAGSPVITYSLGGCYKTTVETINTAPASILGSNTVCVGSVTPLSNPVTGGTWSSSNSGYAPITTGGVVIGNSAGVVTISYTIGSCTSTLPFTISAVPNTITGSGAACIGSTVSLGETTTGGTWSSSNTALATVNTSGVVTAMAVGSPIITYSFGGCFKTTVETVNASPAAIGGSASICVGNVSTLSNTVSGGTWSTSNSGFAPISTGGVVSGSIAGNATITYTIGSCKAVLPITINANTLPVITGAATVCTGSTLTVTDATAGGTWSVNNTLLATINASTGVVTGVGAGSAIVTYSLAGCFKTATIPVNGTYPGAISGANAICAGTNTTLTDTSAAGTWSSTNSTVANVSSTGLVTGSAAGSTNIVYTKNACSVSFPLTVNTNTIASIGGAPLGGVCVGNTITLVDATTGGTWSSNNTSLGSINASTGVLSGVAAGVPTITYTVGGCNKTTGIGVGSPLPAISGSSSICIGTLVTFTDATSGGNWYSSNFFKATVNPSGLVTGVAAGAVTISYVKYGCVATMPITLNFCREGTEANQPSLTNGDIVIEYSLFPNPSTGLINIIQSLPTDMTTDVRVMNYVGQTIFAGSIDFAGGKSQISLANAVPGIYLIELNEGKGKYASFRVVIEQ